MTQKQDMLSTIHFDVIWRDVEALLAERADAKWQHHGESDAGIAMLQALAYGVSDVAYRHLHDLGDILTPLDINKADQTFTDIGPDDALATAPVTEDDYRRLILDETIESDKTGDLYYPVRNVSVTRHPDGDRLQVLLVPERVTPGLNVGAWSDASQKSIVREVEKRLRQHRSLGARAPVVRMAGAQNIGFTLEVDLLSDEVDLAKRFALLYDLLDDWVSPRARRLQDVDAAAESGLGSSAVVGRFDVSTYLPPVPFRPQNRRFSRDPKGLVGGIKSVPGINNIYGIGHPWQAGEATEDQDFVLYGRDFNGEEVRKICEWMPGSVRWCGITIRTTRAVVPDLSAAIIKEIVSLRAPRVRKPRSAVAATGRVAKWRNLTDRVETWQRLPPSFGLHRASATDTASQRLWQFLSAFDGYLGDLCVRLDNLKRQVQFVKPFLSTDFDIEANPHAVMPITGRSEPGEEDLDSDVFARGTVQEHLLQYFGVNQSAATRSHLGFYHSKTVARSDAFIADVVNVGRDRTVARGTFTALQKEVAYALGMYSSAFARDRVTPAPFYMLDVSHLIPKALDEGESIALTLSASTREGGLLEGRAASGTAAKMERGAIVDVSTADDMLSAYPGIVTDVEVESGGDNVTVKLSGEAEAWVTALPSLGNGARVTLRSHRSESAYFSLEDLQHHGDAWTASVALNGTFPWMKPDLPVRIHLLDGALAEARQLGESNGTITLVNEDGKSVVRFVPPKGFTAKQHDHRLFMTVPGLYQTRSGPGRRLAFVFPLPQRLGHVAFKAWQRVVDQHLAALVPAHLEFEVYWLGEGTFSTFEARYLAWRTPSGNKDTVEEGKPGVEAISVMETLGLARVIQPLKGIGTLHIKRESERATSADNAMKKWIFHVKSSVDANVLVSA